MITEIKRLKLIILKDDLDKVLKEIQKTESLMIIKQENNANNSISIDGVITRANQSINSLSKYIPKKEKNQYLEVSLDDFEKVQENENISLIDELVSKKTLLQTEIKSLKEEITSIGCYKELDVRLDELTNTTHSVSHIGLLPQKSFAFATELLDNNNSYYLELGMQKNQRAIFFVNYIDDDTLVINSLKGYGYLETSLPSFNGTVIDYIDYLEDEISNKLQEINIIDMKLTEISKSLPEMKVYVDTLLSKKARNDVEYSESLDTYLIEGYIPVTKIDSLIEVLNNSCDCFDYEIETPDEKEVIPTYTTNNKVVSHYEGITNMFSVPSHSELDPNPIMSFWYWIIMGMMVGDVGYGFVMLVAAFLFIKITKPNKGTKSLATVILYSSVPAMLWGALFNSYFGMSVDFYRGIKPMEDALPMLILSISIGVLHIISGLVMKVIREIKDHNYFEMLSKGLSWIFILIGISLLAGGMALSISILTKIGLGVSLAGVLLILLFAGHQKKNIISKGLSGLIGLYDVTSYLGDLLSYSRIMALIMSSAAVASAMNILAGKVIAGGSIVGYLFAVIIFVFGHLFNLVLGLLSAYVHDCRLQYIEFYGKFYDGGGTLFKPLSLKTKYINEIKINNK